MASPAASTKRPVYLSCVGDVTHPDTWSATPYHFLEAAKDAGLVDAGLPLKTDTSAIKRLRYLWNARNLLLGRGKGGFQYSPTFQERLWKPAKPLSGSIIINHFQLYPPSIRNDQSIEKWHYIDGTLRQLADYYQSPVSDRTMQDAIKEERESYQSSRGIIALSRFAADSVINDYGIPAANVHVAVPGANISKTVYAQHEHLFQNAEQRNSSDELKLLTIGKDWHRKGIDRLLQALSIGRSKGLRATLCIIGCRREELPADVRDIPGVTWAGFISRAKEAERFFKLVTSADVGCLLSRAEFSSIALREYLAFGMPVIGPRTGGCVDLLDPDCCRFVSPEDSPEKIADLLLELQNHPEQLSQLRHIAQQRRHTRLWSQTVQSILSFWPHPVTR